MSRNSSLLIFLLLALLLLQTNSCQHDKLNYTLHVPENNSPEEARILASSEKQKIRIVAYYSTKPPVFPSLTPFLVIDNAPAAIKKSISEQIVPATIAYYQAALKAIPSPEPLSFSSAILKACVNNAKVSIPEALEDGVEVDLALLITGSSQPLAEFIAVANACYLEKGFNR